MYTFKDYYNNKVRLSFDDHPFSTDPKHVWVVSTFRSKWLLTKHKERGWEFPGGKVENGETAAEAAIREVKEETGGIVDKLEYVGQYLVNGKTDNVIKNVYFANVSELSQQQSYFETNGPILIDTFPDNIKIHPNYSFMMKDDVLFHCLKRIESLSLRK